MRSILDIKFDKNTGLFDFKSKTNKSFIGSITISDIYVDCVYYSWDNVQIDLEFSGWIIPLTQKLMSVVLNSNQYPGFTFKVATSSFIL